MDKGVKVVGNKVNKEKVSAQYLFQNQQSAIW